MKNIELIDLNMRTYNILISDFVNHIKSDTTKIERYRDIFKVNEWLVDKKSSYIESILIRAPMTPFILHSNLLTCVNNFIDGIERAKTLIEYMNNEFELTDTKMLHSLEGKKFFELHRSVQRRIEETIIPVHYISCHKNDDLVNIIARMYIHY